MPLQDRTNTRDCLFYADTDFDEAGTLYADTPIRRYADTPIRRYAKLLVNY
ncbi:hypothetical protein [Marivita sp. XM-24bin2]|jgi:hypothetical protein|uniref:hypothetical protein n=1 Tax=unclassified Marivita TaxID=2632480 RepID=UPI0025C457FE|nr:hypothetical protein [Marivita sp. XM-24bin2]